MNRGEALWGEDADAVEAGVDALFGQHPERGGPEREQAAYKVIEAAKPHLRFRCFNTSERQQLYAALTLAQNGGRIFAPGPGNLLPGLIEELAPLLLPGDS